MHRVELVAKIDSIINRLDAAQSDGDALTVRDDLAELWPDLINSVPIVGQLLASQFGDKGDEIRRMDGEGLKEKLLPGLKEYRDFLAKGTAAGPVRNVPNRPGCFGGTASVLLLMVALHLLR